MNDPTTAPEIGSEDAVLAPYLEAATSSKNSAAIRAVVGKVIQDPDLFAGYDQIKAAIGSTEGVDAKLLDTLDLFSYGTFQDYQQQSEKYLPLNEPQLAKLRQLTVLSLIESACQQRQNTVPYATIQQALQMTGDGVPKNRDTELVLSQLLAAPVVMGKLSQKQQAFLVGSSGSSSSNEGGAIVRPRDVHPSKIVDMIAAVQRLRSKLNESNSAIVAQQNQILSVLEQEKLEMDQLEAIYKNSKLGGLDGPYDPMELEHHGRPASRRTKRSRGGFANTIQEIGGSLSNAFGL